VITNTNAPSEGLPPGQLYHDLPRNMILELDHQLSSWGHLLPQQLHGRMNRGGICLTLCNTWKNHDFACNTDVMMAALRARFYGARSNLFSIFLDQALYHPELLSVKDTRYC
jgi:hypothetical protein